MNEILGIDIGVGSIKIVVISKNGDQLSLEAIGETVNKGSSWLKDGSKKSLDAVAGSIKMLLSDMKIKQYKACKKLPQELFPGG